MVRMIPLPKVLRPWWSSMSLGRAVASNMDKCTLLFPKGLCQQKLRVLLNCWLRRKDENQRSGLSIFTDPGGSSPSPHEPDFARTIYFTPKTYVVTQSSCSNNLESR